MVLLTKSKYLDGLRCRCPLGYADRKQLSAINLSGDLIMTCWLINHSWESFKQTHEYCGFQVEAERNKISISDIVVYFGQGLVFGIFEAEELVEDEFKGWKKQYPFQVKLKQLAIAEGGLIAKPLESKFLLQKVEGGSPNLLLLVEEEFEQIKKAIENKQKQLVLR